MRSINGGGYTELSARTHAFAHTYNTDAIVSGFSHTDTDISGWNGASSILYQIHYHTDNASNFNQLVRNNTTSTGIAMEIMR